MRTERQHQLDRTVIRALLQMGEIPLAEPHLLHAALKTFNPPETKASEAEAVDAVRWQAARLRIRALTTEQGIKWLLTENGRGWAAEQGLA